MRDDPGGELEVAEDDVLHFAQDRLPVRVALDRLLADEVENDREIVSAERSERVLVLPDLPEILPVPVDDEDPPSSPESTSSFSLRTPGW